MTYGDAAHVAQIILAELRIEQFDPVLLLPSLERCDGLDGDVRVDVEFLHACVEAVDDAVELRRDQVR